MKKLLFAAVLLLWSVLALAVVNVNTATQAELESLNGIGPVKAKAIIDDRAKNGPYKTVDDLDRVKGIGKATIEKLRKDVSVSGATTVAAEPAKKEAPKAAAATPATAAPAAPAMKSAPATAAAPAPMAAPAKAATPAAAAPAAAAPTKAATTAAAPAATPSKADVAKAKAAAKEAAAKEKAAAKARRAEVRSGSRPHRAATVPCWF